MQDLRENSKWEKLLTKEEKFTIFKMNTRGMTIPNDNTTKP